MHRGDKRPAARGLRRRSASAASACLALLLAGCGGSGSDDEDAGAVPSPAGSSSAPGAAPSAGPDLAEDPELARFYDQDAEWVACAEFQCTKLTMPMDYADPDAGTVQVALVRLKATSSGKRIGTLFLNPGGPGGSGVEYARAATDKVSSAVRARFDIVGFDPRGVGLSDPIDCLSDRDLDEFIEADASPDTEKEKEILVEQAQALAGGCKKKSGKILPFLGTREVARDLDVMREVVGDDELYYLGKSYGTYIGAIYAEQFPSRVGRLVLDGALDPSLPAGESTKAQAAGFELAFAAYAKGCLKLRECPLGDSEEEIGQRVTDFLQQLDRKPLPTRQGRELNESLGLLGIIAAMYNTNSWESLNIALTLGFLGDGSLLLDLSDQYTRRGADGKYEDNSSEVIYAVNCVDHPGRDSREEIEEDEASLIEASPLFGEYIGWGNLPCDYWPTPPNTEPHRIAAEGAAPILVVGTTRDPATPYEWAEALADQLASGVLLTYEGDGHTAYRHGNECIDDAVDEYLIDGDPPRDGKRCD
jgi:pimeloyl-ACP methyl ester carboxylesterase